MTTKALLIGALTLAFGATLAQSLPQITPQGVIVNPVQTTLSVNVTLDKRDSNPIYIAGEKQKISVTVNQDAFVYVFNLQPDGAISVLLPNGYSGGTPYLRAGETRTFPPPAGGYELTIAAPFGAEKILAIASKRRLDLDAFVPSGQSGRFANASIQGQNALALALLALLRGLPAQDWTSAVATFTSTSDSSTVDTGLIRVNANISGARVYVDGVLVGNSPLTISLPAGGHTVRITAPGFTDVETTTNVIANLTAVVDLELTRQVSNGVLVVSVNPKNARVYLQGVLIGTGEVRITVPAGTYTLQILADGFETGRQTVTVESDRTTPVIANLIPLIAAPPPTPVTTYLTAGQIASNNGLEMRMYDFEVYSDRFQWWLSFKNVKSSKILTRINFSLLKVYDNLGKQYLVELLVKGIKTEFSSQENSFELGVNDQGSLYFRTKGDFSDPKITTLFMEMSFYGIEKATWTFEVPH